MIEWLLGLRGWRRAGAAAVLIVVFVTTVFVLVLVAAAVNDALAQGGVGSAGTVEEGGAREGVGRRDPAMELWDEFTLPDREVGRAIREGLPLTAEQIEKILALLSAYRETVARASQPAPKLRSREVELTLDASETAPVVAIQMNYTSSVVFHDATGEPWPVETFRVTESFGPGDAHEGDHGVFMTPEQRYLHGNAVVELAGLSTPIVLELASGSGVVDGRLLVRVPRPGPNADPVVVERTEQFGPGDPVISAFLHGLVPEGARRIKVRGGTRRDRAWRLEDALYLRTAKTLLAPQPLASERGANGDTVYRLSDTPYALVSWEGARLRLEFGGSEEG